MIAPRFKTQVHLVITSYVSPSKIKNLELTLKKAMTTALNEASVESPLRDVTIGHIWIDPKQESIT